MFTNPLQASNNVQDTINKLMAQVDTNQDGVVSNQEFGTFLSSLLKPTTDPTGTTAGASNPTSSTNAGSSSSTSAMPSLPLAPNANMTFEGFDLTRVQDPTVSAKDSFAQAAKLAASMPSTKADSEQWFEQNIRASMEADGLTINWVKGDKFEFTNWQGTYVVDFVRGAGGTSPALSWQASVSSGNMILTGGTPTTLDPNLSLRPAFDQLAQVSGTVPQTKAKTEIWFNQYIRGGLESHGVAINWVIGDKFEYMGSAGPVVIDFIVGAGGPNPHMGWGVE